MTEPTRFVLLRANWRRDGDHIARLPGANPVASFATAAEAEAERAAREERARGGRNPFRVSGPAPASQSNLPDPVLRDWLRDHDIDPPADADWAAWWDAAFPRWSDRQWAAAWQALDRLRFFTVVERPVLYAVVETGWEYNDSGYSADAEGGTVRTLYRSRATAEAERDRLHAERVRRDAGVVWECYSCHSRLSADPFGLPVPYQETYRRPADAPFYEVVEVPAEGDP